MLLILDLINYRPSHRVMDIRFLDRFGLSFKNYFSLFHVRSLRITQSSWYSVCDNSQNIDSCVRMPFDEMRQVRRGDRLAGLLILHR